MPPMFGDDVVSHPSDFELSEWDPLDSNNPSDALGYSPKRRVRHDHVARQMGDFSGESKTKPLPREEQPEYQMWKQREHTCVLCKVFYDGVSMWDHLRSSHKEYGFIKAQKTVQRSRIITCALCGVSVNHYTDLIHHYRARHPQSVGVNPGEDWTEIERRNRTCPLCGEIVTTAMGRHAAGSHPSTFKLVERINYGTTPYKCRMCHRRGSLKQILIHVVSHANDSRTPEPEPIGPPLFGLSRINKLLWAILGDQK